MESGQLEVGALPKTWGIRYANDLIPEPGGPPLPSIYCVHTVPTSTTTVAARTLVSFLVALNLLFKRRDVHRALIEDNLAVLLRI